MAASVAADASDVRGGAETRGRTASVLARLLSVAVLLWAALCGIGYLLTHAPGTTSFEHSDGAVDRWLASHRSAPWNAITHWLTYGAETITVTAVGLVLFVALRLYLHRWRESLFLLVTLAGEVTIFVCTTLIIDRKRPPVPHLDSAPPTSSFPSGHTAAAVCLYGAIAIIAVSTSRRTWLRAAAVLVAVLAPCCVGFARLYRGMHYPSDVAGGALLAVCWLVTAWLIVLRPGRADHEAARAHRGELHTGKHHGI
jgi:membrane-associated phospholipid phosphatase